MRLNLCFFLAANLVFGCITCCAGQPGVAALNLLVSLALFQQLLKPVKRPQPFPAPQPPESGVPA